MNSSMRCHGVPFLPQESAGQQAPHTAAVASVGGRTLTAVADCAQHLAGQLPSLQAAQEPDPAPPPWFEGLIPGPREDVADQLKTDAYLKGTLPGWQLDYATYQREVDCRVRLKEQGKEDDYTFKPFVSLLDNMELVAHHLLEDRQFEDRTGNG